MSVQVRCQPLRVYDLDVFLEFYEVVWSGWMLLFMLLRLEGALMKISRVYIENYRSIKKLDFSPGNYCVLIGENNAGKSNILKAVNLFSA